MQGVLEATGIGVGGVGEGGARWLPRGHEIRGHGQRQIPCVPSASGIDCSAGSRFALPDRSPTEVHDPQVAARPLDDPHAHAARCMSST